MTGGPGTWADSGNPFGFETNTHPLEYEYCTKEPGWFRGHGYKCSSAPRPHPDLEVYALQFVEDIGLCFIQAGSRDLGVSGLAHDQWVELFKDKIVQKYGPSTKEEKPDKEKFDLGYNIYWNSKAGFKGVGDVQGIELHSTDGYGTAVSFLLVTYDTCQQKIEENRTMYFKENSDLMAQAQRLLALWDTRGEKGACFYDIEGK